MVFVVSQFSGVV